MNHAQWVARINLNRSGELAVPCFPVAGKKWANITIQPESASYTTFVANVRYRLNPGDSWRDFPTTIQLTQASPTHAGPINVSGLPEINVQITTAQGAESYANVYGFAEGNID